MTAQWQADMIVFKQLSIPVAAQLIHEAIIKGNRQLASQLFRRQHVAGHQDFFAADSQSIDLMLPSKNLLDYPFTISPITDLIAVNVQLIGPDMFGNKVIGVSGTGCFGKMIGKGVVVPAINSGDQPVPGLKWMPG